MALPRPWQVIGRCQHRLKKIWKLPPEKAQGTRRPVRGTTIEVVQYRPHLVAAFWQAPMIMLHLRQIPVATFNGRGRPLEGPSTAGQK